MIDTVALREKVLDLAIRGKLVPQDPNDEPASVLLERIRAQKQQMVKDGKLKAKDIKDDSIIFVGEDNLHYEKFADGSTVCIDDYLPFDIPKSWAWCNLGTLTDVFGRIGFRGYTKNDFVSKGEGAISLSPSNIVNNSMNYDQCSYITWEKYEESPEIMIYDGDILLVKTGSSYGKSTIVTNLPEKATINPQFVVLKSTRIDTRFLCYYLQSAYCIQQYEKFVGGTAIPTFSQANLKAMYIAVPPLGEQIRIANEITQAEELISIVDSNRCLIGETVSTLKSKILDLAIRGKLVPQNPEDEPASVLLDRIRAEKEELIKQGKIKRDKKESVIFKGEDNSYYEKIGNETRCIDSEVQFDLPTEWVWCRGYSCFSGMKTRRPDGDTFRYIDIDSIDNKVHKIKQPKEIATKDAPSRANRAVQIGSVLFSFVRPYLENIAYISEDNKDCIASTGFYVCNSNGMLYPPFMYFLMISEYVVQGLNQFMKGDNSPSISKDNIENWLYPIPPISEQKLICTKIEELIRFISTIEKSLN